MVVSLHVTVSVNLLWMLHFDWLIDDFVDESSNQKMNYGLDTVIYSLHTTSQQYIRCVKMFT